MLAILSVSNSNSTNGKNIAMPITCHGQNSLAKSEVMSIGDVCLIGSL